jgi:hypothetical protein
MRAGVKLLREIPGSIRGLIRPDTHHHPVAAVAGYEAVHESCGHWFLFTLTQVHCFKCLPFTPNRPIRFYQLRVCDSERSLKEICKFPQLTFRQGFGFTSKEDLNFRR